MRPPDCCSTGTARVHPPSSCFSAGNAPIRKQDILQIHLFCSYSSSPICHAVLYHNRTYVCFQELFSALDTQWPGRPLSFFLLISVFLLFGSEFPYLFCSLISGSEVFHMESLRRPSRSYLFAYIAPSLGYTVYASGISRGYSINGWHGISWDTSSNISFLISDVQSG